jgi:hypothetical protein
MLRGLHFNEKKPLGITVRQMVKFNQAYLVFVSVFELNAIRTNAPFGPSRVPRISDPWAIPYKTFFSLIYALNSFKLTEQGA